MPSSSKSAKQSSLPSQLASMSSPAISVALGLMSASPSLQSPVTVALFAGRLQVRMPINLK